LVNQAKRGGRLGAEVLGEKRIRRAKGGIRERGGADKKLLLEKDHKKPEWKEN